MKTSERFRDARERISAPTKWTKGSMAKDQYGQTTTRLEDEVCWCAYGSLNRTYMTAGRLMSEYDPTIGTTVSKLFDRAARIIAGHPEDVPPMNEDVPLTLISFNDGHRTTHEEILSVFDCAIGLAEQAESTAA